jgi:hypothetical protein
MTMFKKSLPSLLAALLIGGAAFALTKDSVYLPAATDELINSFVSGDTVSRFNLNADGDLEWGSGSDAVDTNLYRSAANTLKTDDSFTVGTNLAVTGTSAFTGSVTLAQVVAPTETLAAAEVLTTADCGKTLFLSHATEFATTLPAPSAGCGFKFFVANAPESASYTIVTNASANVLIGGFNELEVDTGDDGPYSAAGDTITFVDGVSVVGDYVEMISDGTSWYLHGQTNADGGATIAGT